MSKNDLVDRLVVEEFEVFADDALGYTADRDRAVESLLNNGVADDEAYRAWVEFERRYLTTGDGGLTLSAHALDRASALGKQVAVDEDVRAEIYEALREADGRMSEDGLRGRVDASDAEFEQSLWTLRRRGVVETRTDAYGDDRSVVLTEPSR